MVHDDGQRAVVPQHASKTPKRASLAKILREACIDPETFGHAWCGKTPQ
jgi:predicted RNA binding protein YcfA (HicA-like mRNA interferase family)